MVSVENEMNYDVWFGGEKIIKRKYTQMNNYLIEMGGYDSDPDLEEYDSDDIIKSHDVVTFYYDTILEDKTGKYFFISKRRVKWFLLKMVHLKDCTLTYKKLWDLKVKKELLKKLEKMSISLEIEGYELECAIEEDQYKNIKTPEEFIIRLKKDNLDKYKKGIREELDLPFHYDGKGMSDKNADDFVSYALTGERDSNNPKIKQIYKNEWCSDYMVGEMVDEFTFKIMMYDMLLLSYNCETFLSYLDSSPLSSLKEYVGEYLFSQYREVENIIGKIEAKRLLRIRNRLEKYSHNILTMFQVYRMFNML